VTRPEGIWFGMTIVLCGWLAAVVTLSTCVVMAIRLGDLSRTSAETDEMVRKRRRIVSSSLLVIGGSATLWVVLVALDIWWNILRGFPFERLLHALHQRLGAPRS
jgi:hypothetical protein